MADSPEQHGSVDHFNKHMLNLQNIAAVSANSDAKVSKNFAKIYNAQLQRGGLTGAAEESARKSLEVLQQVVQTMVNESVDNVLQQFIVKFFEPAFINIEKNCGRQLDKNTMTTVICRRLLEEVIAQVYPLPSDLSPATLKKHDDPSTPVSSFAASSTPQSNAEDSSPPFSHNIPAGKIFQKPAPATANDVETLDQVYSPPTIGGRLRALKARKRSFSDSEHLSLPPRSVRVAAQRAAEKVAAANGDNFSHTALNSEHRQSINAASSKRLRSDTVAAFGKPTSVITSTSGKVATPQAMTTVLLRNPQH